MPDLSTPASMKQPFERAFHCLMRPWRGPERIAHFWAFAALTPLVVWPFGGLWMGRGFLWFYGFPIRTVMVQGHPLRGQRDWLEGCGPLNFVCYFVAVSLVGNLMVKIRRRWPGIKSGWGLCAFVIVVYGVLSVLCFGVAGKSFSVWVDELKG